MVTRTVRNSIYLALVLAAAPIVASATVIATKTVPWVAAAPATPHFIWNGKATTLKGTSNVQDTGAGTILYDWNPGDGGSHCTGTVTNMYVVECAHTYAAQPINNVLNATLTIYDCSTGTGGGSPCNTAPYSNSSSASYFVQIYSPPPNLSVEVNAAIDDGLWYLHKTANHQVVSTGGILTSVSITTPGQDYAVNYSAAYAGTEQYCCQQVSYQVTGFGGSGSGASLSGTLDTTYGSATYGSVTSLTVNNPGTGYVAPVTITATDDICYYRVYYSYYYSGACGSGFSGTATASALGGSTTFINWNPGTGGVDATNCTAFEVSGHLESGPASDPYTEDVAGCLRQVFSVLTTSSVAGTRNHYDSTIPGTVAYTPDSNGNALGVRLNQGEDQYQSGMMLDAVTASGTPSALVTTGPLAALTHPPSGIGPYTYKDAVTDMVDYNIYCMSANGSTSNQGSWNYGCQPGAGDNSVAQWVAIGMISGVRDFGVTVPTLAKDSNKDWLTYSQVAGFGGVGGRFGYSNSNEIGWGPFATTPAGMVQLAFNGIGRSATAVCCTGATNSTATQWDWSETFMRNRFDNPQTHSPTNAVKDYYYGMFSLTKSMLLHDSSPGGISSPTSLQYLRSLDDATKPDIDWYAAEDATFGGTDTSNGVARTLVSGTPSNGVAGQNGDGSWSGHDYTSTTSQFNTAWAIIMLNRTVTQIVPVACITPTNPTGPNNTSVHVNGACSTTQDQAKSVVLWQWDVSCNAGTNFTKTGVDLNNVFVKPTGPDYPYNCPVRLRVSDNGNPALTGDLVFNVVVTQPDGSVAPNANIGGPYNFCKNLTPWYLDGSHTTQSPPDTITSYNWDYDCNNSTESNAIQPRVDTGANNLFSRAAGQYCVKLTVVNNDNLSSVVTTQVNVHDANEIACTNCVSVLSAKAKSSAPGSPGNVQIYWTDTNSDAFAVHHYNVLRSPNADFSGAVTIAGTGGAFPAIPAPAVRQSQLLFTDTSAAKAATYYYRISPATAANIATCSSPITLKAVVGGR